MTRRGRVPRSGEDRAAHVEVDHRAALAALLRFLRGAARDLGDRLEAAEGAPDACERVGGVEVARDGDHDVVGRVIGPEEVLTRLHRNGLDVAAPADRRHAIRMRLEREPEQQLEGAPVRLVLGAQPALLEHHLPFARERLLGDLQIGESLRLQFDHERQRVGRDVLEVDRRVGRGVGVHATAAALDHALVRLGRQPIGAAEHHVLEEVRESRVARFVLRARTHPHLERNAGRCGIRKQQHGETVVELRDLRAQGGIIHVRRGKRIERDASESKRERGCERFAEGGGEHGGLG